MSDRPPPRPGPDDHATEEPWDYEHLFTDDEPDTPLRRRPSIRLVRWVAIAVVALVGVLLVGSFVRNQFNPPGPPGNEVTVQVPSGASTADIAEILERRGVVPSALAFRISTRIRGEGNFQAGEYDFRSRSSTGEAIATLKEGPKVVTDRLTIPEGFRVRQIAERVGRLPGMSTQRFLDLVQSGTFRSDFQPPGTRSLEGFLFPDTYLLSAADNEETLINRMVNQFDARARATGLSDSLRTVTRTPYETLIIASMIEAEAKVDEDRAKISQVIHNRLQANMRLQIDATVLYALGNTKDTLSRSDLQFSSPWNTYVNAGLPPTPINNPGAESIRAALRPEPGPWMYYVLADSTGAHAFAVTLEEHNRNVAAAREKGLL